MRRRRRLQADLTTAYNAAAGTPGTLTLNFQGNPNALFLFKFGSTLTTASGSSVVLTNTGGTSCPTNLFWQVGSSATLGTGSTFAGNILALTSITMTTGAGLSGRALARNGAVTLDTNTVNIAACAGAPPIPALDFVRLTILMFFLAAAGVFALKRLAT